MDVLLVALTRLKKLTNRKRYTDEYDCYPIQMAPQVNHFAGFCHHHLVNTSVHMHAYCYPLFESGMKTAL